MLFLFKLLIDTSITFILAVSSKILHLTAVSFNPSKTTDPAFLDIHQDVELKSKNLSCVLHKLYLWEKKLYEEVKVHC